MRVSLKNPNTRQYKKSEEFPNDGEIFYRDVAIKACGSCCHYKSTESNWLEFKCLFHYRVFKARILNNTTIKLTPKAYVSCKYFVKNS